jgi:hypothetical protein
MTSVFLLLFYWRGLNCWFYQDDFGWLHLGPAHSIKEFLIILFAPKAHGNIRPWSENLFFYGLHAMFGMNALPFRIVVFATAIANLFLLGAIVRRVIKPGTAEVVAQLCWLMNPAVSIALCWTCIYNQTQSVFFLLLSLLLLIQGYKVAHTVTFTLGLGSLETVVMYPAIALLYAVLYDRSSLRRVTPVFAISLAFLAIHFVAAPTASSGPYALRFDSRMLKTFAAYSEIVLGPERLMHFHWTWPAWVLVVATAIMAAATLACAWLAGRAGLLGLAWFVLLLVPLLPLPDHVVDYALTGPAVGLAIVFAGALVHVRHAALAAAAYLAICMPASWEVMTWHYDRSQISRKLVTGVLEYKRIHPGQTLLLTGMDTDQFIAGYADLPFELYGIKDVFLAPGAEQSIHDPARIAPLYVLDQHKADSMLQDGKAAVLSVSGGRIEKITANGAR